jgi:hypothetical protein
MNRSWNSSDFGCSSTNSHMQNWANSFSLSKKRIECILCRSVLQFKKGLKEDSNLAFESTERRTFATSGTVVWWVSMETICESESVISKAIRNIKQWFLLREINHDRNQHSSAVAHIVGEIIWKTLQWMNSNFALGSERTREVSSFVNKKVESVSLKQLPTLVHRMESWSILQINRTGGCLVS